MAETNAAISLLNEKNADFWATESKAMRQNLADQATFETATGAIASELKRQVPSYSQMTFESAVFNAEQARMSFASNLGSRGGKAKKADALQRLIEKIAEKDLTISTAALLDQLKEFELIRDVIYEIEDENIFFVDYDGSNKIAPISGLKDRLSRAKKKLLSR